MDQYTQGRLSSQVRRSRRDVLEDQDLCFTKLLPQEQVEAALERHQVCYRKRLCTPLLTIGACQAHVVALVFDRYKPVR